MPDETTETETPKYTRENTPDAFAAVLAIANELAGLNATMAAAFFDEHGFTVTTEISSAASALHEINEKLEDKDGRSVGDTLTRIYLDGAG